jgi:phenylacetate-coenzyme A ligase PaaK-like adenylate-forming protein
LSESPEFGTFDSMRDAMQGDYLGALPASIERLRFGPSELAAHQTRGLRSLLVHAAAHSRFHRERLVGIDLERFELADLTRLPVMTKTDMMDNLGAVYTDPA